MAELIKEAPVARPLRADRLAALKRELTQRLASRVAAAYLFGSAARGDYRADSDLDLALIVSTQETFVRRAFVFEDLFELYPRLDILVYTPEEFERLRARETPFWSDFRRDALQLA